MTNIAAPSVEPVIPGSRPCPICRDDAVAVAPFLADSVRVNSVTGSSFASRKSPEYMSHAMQRCTRCDLVFVDRPPNQNDLALSYHAADYDSAEEAEHAADSYAEAIRPVLARLDGRMDAALEIGTGTAAFLARLHDAGFRKVVGVEPSIAAINAARPERRDWIREGIFEEADFAPESFDLITCFMTLEHVLEPGDLVASALRLLRPGGAFVGVTHDYRGWVNRLLGTRSPIVDIEHMQLFSAASAGALLTTRGFEDVGVRGFANAYRPSYWMRLLPIHEGVKRAAIRTIKGGPLDALRLPFNVGNTMSWGFKTQGVV
ncbi:class I SAM-dependent methyltransferase [Novosphingobium sp.]|uniref:class I SAM-dependent methyltransferase n=1 Tax=Novosphingobium sp. TaxID=1874826 RepID=UPI003D101B5E